MFIDKIRKDGYCIIPQVYSPTEVHLLLESCKHWYEITETAKDVPFLNRNQPNVYNLQNKSIHFLQAIFKSADTMEVLRELLNDIWYKQIPQDKPNFILRAIGARSSNTALPLHIDSFIPYEGDHPLALQVAIVLEDQTVENGCTVVVPGSHLSGEYAPKQADSIPLTPKAGDLVMWDSRLWHGTTENTTQGTRWAIIATFTRWWVKQQFNITDNLPDHIYQQLTDEQKSILGFCSIPYNNESEGIDLKRGYEDLGKELNKVL